MAKVCFKKCVVNNDAELSVGELSCTDRCVGKYMQAQEKVGLVLNSLEKTMLAEQKAAQASGKF